MGYIFNEAIGMGSFNDLGLSWWYRNKLRHKIKKIKYERERTLGLRLKNNDSLLLMGIWVWIHPLKFTRMSEKNPNGFSTGKYICSVTLCWQPKTVVALGQLLANYRAAKTWWLRYITSLTRIPNNLEWEFVIDSLASTATSISNGSPTEDHWRRASFTWESIKPCWCWPKSLWASY